MVYGCGNSCIKFLFFVVNLLICIFGALIFGFSLWANLDKDFATHIRDFVDKVDPADAGKIDDIAKYQASLWVLVGVGALLFLVGFLGCCGAACESTVLLSLFFFIVMILTVLELAATVFAIVNKDKFIDTVKEALKKSSESKEQRKNITPIQDVFNCCGATSETKQLYINDGLCEGHESQKDCFTAITNVIEESGETVIIIAFVLLAIEVFSLIFACALCRASREVRYASYYA